MLMQFERVPTPLERQQLARNGIRILGYVPNNTYRVSVDDPAAAMAVNTAGGVRWAWIPDPDDKVANRVRNDDFPPNARHGDGMVSVYIRLAEDADEAEARLDITAVGQGTQIVKSVGKGLLEVRTRREQIRMLAALDLVTWIEPAPPPPVANNVVAAQRIKADVLQVAPYGLTGSPVTIGVWDEGAVFAHGDFGSRLTVVDSLASVSDHSTHVAGTIAGSGAGNSAARGMAPGAALRSYDWYDDSIEMRASAAFAPVEYLESLLWF